MVMFIVISNSNAHSGRE